MIVRGHARVRFGFQMANRFALVHSKILSSSASVYFKSTRGAYLAVAEISTLSFSFILVVCKFYRNDNPDIRGSHSANDLAESLEYAKKPVVGL